MFQSSPRNVALVPPWLAYSFSGRLCAQAALFYCLVLTLLAVTACSQRKTQGDISTHQPSQQRFPAVSLAELSSDPARVERALREQLVADPFAGPTRNNLGVALLQQGKLFEAATEFEAARKLMPGHPDPRVNLGLTFERASRTQEALASYEAALETNPEHIPAKQALARLRLAHFQRDDRTKQLVQEIAFAGDTTAWRDWARFRLAAWGEESLTQPMAAKKANDMRQTIPTQNEYTDTHPADGGTLP